MQRDFPGTRGQQGRTEGRLGAGMSLVVPLVRWLRLVGSFDAEVVALAREGGPPTANATEEPPRPFPSSTLGGSLGVEVPL